MDTCDICIVNSINISHCGVCGLNICANCFTSHNHDKYFTTKTHKQWCKSHSAESTRFCVECKEYVCSRKCKMENHCGHTITTHVKGEMGCISKENPVSNSDVDMLSTQLSTKLTMRDENRTGVDDVHRRTGETHEYCDSERNIQGAEEKLQKEVEDLLTENSKNKELIKNSRLKADLEIQDLKHANQRLKEQIQDMTTNLSKSKSTADEEVQDLKRNNVWLSEQIQKMANLLTEQEEEKAHITEMTSKLLLFIPGIEGMTSFASNVEFPSHQNKNMDTFTKQIQDIINKFIALKNGMITKEKELHDKVLEYMEWTNSQLKEDGERSKVLDHTKEQLQVYNASKKHIEKELEASTSKLRQSESTIADLRTQNGKLQQQAYVLQKELEDWKKQSSYHIQEMENSSKRVQELQIQLQIKQTDMDNLTRKLSRQEEELKSEKRAKEDLQTRLSSMAGDRLTKGNPGITDLSDPNRPMRIGEMFSELYDNEWTDALECTDAVKQHYPGLEESAIQEIIIHHLVKLLKICYKECLLLSKQQMQSMKNSIIDMLQLNTEGTQEQDIANLPGCREILNFRKRNAAKLVDDMIQHKIPTMKIETTDWEYAYKNADLIQQLVKTPFFTKSLHLCWCMVIQDPVMHLGDDPLPDSIYDKNIYREFVKSGDKVGFVVWPPLFLHEAGPLLCKGVIQAYS